MYFTHWFAPLVHTPDNLATSPATAEGNYWMCYPDNDIKGIDRHERDRHYGYSFRCIKD